MNFGILQPRSATSSTAGGHTAERAEVQDVTFSKLTDLATPVLLQTWAAGKTLPKAKFQFMRADGDGKPVPYFEIELENLIIGAINPGLEGGGLMREHVSLKIKPGEVEVYPAKNQRRRGWQHNWRLGFSCK